MGYTRPVDAPISASWQSHRNRNPPSSEPGTDYACAYGTPIRAAGTGTVVDRTTSTAGGTGRFITLDMDDGRRVRYLHLSQLFRSVGDRVGEGDHIAASGASGFGSDWGYGAHVHTTLWPGHYYDFPDTIDFELYVGPDAPPIPPSPPNRPEGEAIMYIRSINSGDFARAGYIYANDIGGHWRGVSNLEGEGYILPLASDSQLPYAEFHAGDIDLLFALNGLWEQNILAGDQTWSSGKQLIGLGSLTGRLMYPGRPDWSGQWHYPYNENPVPTPPASEPTATLSGPVWAIGGILGIIGLVEVIRLVVSLAL